MLNEKKPSWILIRVLSCSHSPWLHLLLSNSFEDNGPHFQDTFLVPEGAEGTLLLISKNLGGFLLPGDSLKDELKGFDFTLPNWELFQGRHICPQHLKANASGSAVWSKGWRLGQTTNQKAWEESWGMRRFGEKGLWKADIFLGLSKAICMPMSGTWSEKPREGSEDLPLLTCTGKKWRLTLLALTQSCQRPGWEAETDPTHPQSKSAKPGRVGFV